MKMSNCSCPRILAVVFGIHLLFCAVIYKFSDIFLPDSQQPYKADRTSKSLLAYDKDSNIFPYISSSSSSIKHGNMKTAKYE